MFSLYRYKKYFISFLMCFFWGQTSSAFPLPDQDFVDLHFESSLRHLAEAAQEVMDDMDAPLQSLFPV